VCDQPVAPSVPSIEQPRDELGRKPAALAEAIGAPGVVEPIDQAVVGAGGDGGKGPVDSPPAAVFLIDNRVNATK
jgi:hypothetical protein